MPSPDDQVWQELLAAEREVARCRAALRRSPGRDEVLRAALRDPMPAGRQAALDYLRSFPDEVPGVLEDVVDLSVSLGWAKHTRDALWAARRDVDPMRLADVAASLVMTGDDEDAVNLSWLVLEIGGRPALLRFLESITAHPGSESRQLHAAVRAAHEHALGAAEG